MATTKAAKAAVPEIILVGLSQLSELFNPRTDYGDIKSLAASIEANGIKVPLRVKATGEKKGDLDVYEIKAGHRRFAAIKSIKGAGKTLVPVMVQPEGYDAKQEIYDHVATNEGKELTLLEQAHVFSLAREAGDSDAEIARHAGKSQTHIADCLLLWDEGSPKLKEQIAKGKTSATLAIQQLKELKAAAEAKAKTDAENPDAANAAPAETVGEATDKVFEKAAAVAGDKKITKKHIDEADGKKAAAKINNTSSKPTKVITEAQQAKEANAAAPGPDKTLEKLLLLKTTLNNQTDAVRKPGSFEVLDAIIGFADGSVKAIALVDLFFVQEEESAPTAAPEAEATAPAAEAGVNTNLD